MYAKEVVISRKQCNIQTYSLLVGFSNRSILLTFSTFKDQLTYSKASNMQWPFFLAAADDARSVYGS